MWVLRRVSEGSDSTEKSSLHLIVGEYLVGRKVKGTSDCQIIIPHDQTVSRKHAQITVHHNTTSKASAAQVTVKDFSKFGTSVNDVKCQNSVSVDLKHGDKITFGTQGSIYWLTREPLVVFASCLDNSKKKLLKTLITKLGGYMVGEWQKECTHLVMDALSFTVKVIYALVTCCSIVKTSYFEDLLKGISTNSELPLVEKHMPPIKEQLIDPKVVSFQPDEARKSLFAGKLFLFLEKKQYKGLEQVISLAGGTSLLKEYGDIPGDNDLLTDENTLVMSVDLKSAIQADQESWVGHVGDILTSCNRRPIAETEVGLAILHSSLEEYCNSSKDHVPRITKNIVSKSLSSMEAMSQRIHESQNISVMSIPEKKPISCRTDVDQSMKVRSNSSGEISPQGRNKRSRGCTSEKIPLATDTPLVDDTPFETKRRKLSTSVSEVTHISQTQHSGVEAKTENMSSMNRSYEQSKQSTSKVEVTHISQSQDSAPNEPNVPHARSSSKEMRSNVKSGATILSKNRDSRIEFNNNDTSMDSLSGGKRRRKLITPKPEVTHAPQSPESPTDIRIRETPSPEISFQGKRRKVVSPSSDITHISMTERSLPEEHRDRSNTDKCLSFTSASTPTRQSTRIIKQEQCSEGFKNTINSTTSQKLNIDKNTTNSKQIGEIQDLVKSENDTSDVKQVVKSENNTPDIKHVIKSENNTSNIEQVVKSENSARHVRDTLNAYEDCKLGIGEFDSADGSPARQKLRREDTHDKNLSNVKSGSGWISKKSGNQHKRSKKDQSSTSDSKRVRSDAGIGNLDFVDENSSRSKEIDLPAQKLTNQGFLSKQGGRKEPRSVLVKQEDDSDLPSNVLCVEYVELVVARNVPRNNRVTEEQRTTKLKNTKRFRKKNYPGCASGLPRIIGGSDLVVFSSRSKDVEDWFIGIQEMNRERDLEDEAADDLFQYEPINKRRNKK